MSEAHMRKVLVKALAPLDAVAIESPSTGLGIPDVNFIGGWFECKRLMRWPKGADKNPVKFKHDLSKEQKVWLYRRSMKGGLAMCVCQVHESWFFFDGIRIKDLWNNMTRPEMIAQAELYMKRGLNKRKLVDFLLERNSGYLEGDLASHRQKWRENSASTEQLTLV